MMRPGAWETATLEPTSSTSMSGFSTIRRSMVVLWVKNRRGNGPAVGLCRPDSFCRPSFHAKGCRNRYLQSSRVAVVSRRTAALAYKGIHMIQDAEFFLKGGHAGVLLVHGLTGTPAEMALLGKGLNKAGFTVHGVQLAGHCGSEDDLLASGWRDWCASVQDAAARMRQNCSHMFVAGLSMGALLALDLAAEQPDWIAGVGVLGATFRYDGWGIPPIARLSFLLPALKRLGLFGRTSFVERAPYGLRDERIRARISMAMFSQDSSVAGLPGNPWHSLAELHTLAVRTRRRLPRVTAPCLVAHATEDDVASLQYNAGLVMRRVSGPVELLPLADSYHMITIDRERRLLIERLAEFFTRHADGVLAPRGRVASAA